MKIFKKILAGLFICSLIALYITVYVVPGVTEALTKTEVLQYGNLRLTDSVTCYFIRNEKVYAASYAGTINYYIGDSVHVKKGTRILNVTRGANSGGDEENEYADIADIMKRLSGDCVELTDFVTEFNGLTSYYIDGYENYFTPENMRGLKYDRIGKLNTEAVNVVRAWAAKGEPLYKICDYKEWYIACWIDAGNVSKYAIDKTVNIEMDLGQVRAIITEIIEDGDKWLIIFKTDRYYEDFTKVRSAPATVVTSNYSGIIIRNESMTVNGGEVGVLVKTKSGEYVFKPVKIITTDGQNSLVEVSYYYDDEGNRVGTVNIYDEVLKNPSDYYLGGEQK